MEIRKRLKKYGNSIVIVFTKEDIDTYGLKEGDTIGLNFHIVEKQTGESK